jgi:uncharacterized cupin superfamily protein
MVHASKFEAGPPDDWKRWEFQHPMLPRPVRGKLLLGELLGLAGMEVSLNSLAPGAAMPFAHRHREHEELYVFLSGRGELRVDDESFEVVPGSCVRIAPNGSRIWRNAGDEPLLYIVIQASACGSVRGIADGEPCPPPSDWPAPTR